MATDLDDFSFPAQLLDNHGQGFGIDAGLAEAHTNRQRLLNFSEIRLHYQITTSRSSPVFIIWLISNSTGRNKFSSFAAPHGDCTKAANRPLPLLRRRSCRSSLPFL